MDGARSARPMKIAKKGKRKGLFYLKRKKQEYQSPLQFYREKLDRASSLGDWRSEDRYEREIEHYLESLGGF
jgi:hypothetical protein